MFPNGSQRPSVLPWYPSGHAGNGICASDWFKTERREEQYHYNRSETAYGYYRSHYTSFPKTDL